MEAHVSGPVINTALGRLTDSSIDGQINLVLPIATPPGAKRPRRTPDETEW